MLDKQKTKRWLSPSEIARVLRLRNKVKVIYWIRTGLKLDGGTVTLDAQLVGSGHGQYIIKPKALAKFLRKSMPVNGCDRNVVENFLKTVG
jgi:hypothetical protein